MKNAALGSFPMVELRSYSPAASRKDHSTPWAFMPLVRRLRFWKKKESNISRNASYTLHARFDHIGDLKVRARVALAGVTIGRVSQIVVDPDDYRATVDFRIDSTFNRLPIDTFASVATSGILGGKYIDLSPGGDDTVLQVNDEMEFTQSAILLENLIGKFMLNSNSESAK